MLMSDQPKVSDSDKNVNIRMEKRDGETYVALGLFILAVGLPVIFGTYYAYAPVKSVDFVVSRGATALVPDMTQQTERQARKVIGELGLAVGEVKGRFDAAVPQGKVIGQDPAAGASAEPTAKVNLVISRGAPHNVIMPRLTRQPKDIAIRMVEHAQLEAGSVTDDFSLDIPEGIVIRQNPAEDVSIPSGTTVDLVVSKGPEAVSSPDLMKLSAADAKKAIESAGFVLGPMVDVFNATVPAGSVVDQRPAPGEPINRGAIIQLTVSRGQGSGAFSVMPGVAGQSEELAAKSINEKGMKVGVVTKAFSPTVPAGAIIKQSPAAGTYLEPHLRAATVNFVCAVVLLLIGVGAIIYGRLLLTRNKGRD